VADIVGSSQPAAPASGSSAPSASDELAVPPHIDEDIPGGMVAAAIETPRQSGTGVAAITAEALAPRVALASASAAPARALLGGALPFTGWSPLPPMMLGALMLGGGLLLRRRVARR